MTDQRKSIVEEIKGGRFEASILATFNAYLPFYEEVVLPHLRNSGSRQNIVLMDAAACGAVLSVESLRPRSAGRDYSLLPISCTGAFHPKLVFLVGKKRGLLLVGSHNLTLAGFGHNRELSSRFEFITGNNGNSLGAFKSVWEFIKGWTANSPEHLQKTIDQIGATAPWLEESGVDEVSPVLASLPKGPSLWSQLKERLPKKTARITIVGPFFDSEFAFLSQLQTEYPRAELIVGIDPETVVLNENARSRLSKIVVPDQVKS
jgi:hypothetical protein